MFESCQLNLSKFSYFLESILNNGEVLNNFAKTKNIMQRFSEEKAKGFSSSQFNIKSVKGGGGVLVRESEINLLKCGMKSFSINCSFKHFDKIQPSKSEFTYSAYFFIKA